MTVISLITGYAETVNFLHPSICSHNQLFHLCHCSRSFFICFSNPSSFSLMSIVSHAAHSWQKRRQSPDRPWGRVILYIPATLSRHVYCYNSGMPLSLQTIPLLDHFFRRHWINLVIVIAFTCYAYDFPLSPSLVHLLPSFCWLATPWVTSFSQRSDNTSLL